MWSLIKGVAKAPLLRRVWFQCFCFSVVVVALIHVAMGYQRFYAYQSALEECSQARLEAFNDAIAKEVKRENFQVVGSQLSSIEFSCAKAKYASVDLNLGNKPLELASFYWRVERDDIERFQLGKNLLKGPRSSLVYPLSIWNDGLEGEYWIGKVVLDVYYGAFIEDMTSGLWRIFMGSMLVVLLLSLVTFLWIYRKFVVPSRRFEAFASSGQSNASALRALLDKRDDELSGVWRVFLEAQEASQVERFEFEAQVRDLESHISKIERGQVGQSLSTVQSSFDIKLALARVLNSLDAFSSEKGAQKDLVYSASDDFGLYLTAVMSVAANLHERAKTEAGDLILAELHFNVRVLVAQILTEFTPRLEARHVVFDIEIDAGVPDMVSGDPEKLKRVIRNAFKRVLLEPHLGKVTFKVFGRNDLKAGGRTVFELNALPNKLAPLDHSNEAREALADRPSAMLEMLCYMMGARWTFTPSLDGELRQSLSINLSPIEPTTQLDTRGDVSGLRCIVFDAKAKNKSMVYQTAKHRFSSIEYFSSETHLFDSLRLIKETGRHCDVLIVSDDLHSYTVEDFLSEARRIVGTACTVVVVPQRPQIGDARRYQDLGANVFVGVNEAERFMLDLIMLASQSRTDSSHSEQLITPYTLLDSLGVSDEFSLPKQYCHSPDYTVMLVAQELVNIEFVRALCKVRNLRFIHFDSVLNAVDTFKQELFDLVIVDDLVESVDSFTTIQMLRKIEARRDDSHSTSIFAITEAQSEEAMNLFERIGTSEIIKKPLFNAQLGAFVAQYLR